MNENEKKTMPSLDQVFMALCSGIDNVIQAAEKGGPLEISSCRNGFQARPVVEPHHAGDPARSWVFNRFEDLCQFLGEFYGQIEKPKEEEGVLEVEEEARGQ